ncbi:hypothetical protein FQR65_LT03022 [Abscondita terminalis]|nr:hypothetical protein FQR65_LT03022 [Abscondita terminalis]
MRRSTRTKKRQKAASADEAEPESPKPPPNKKKLKVKEDDSSSDSDIESYLQPAHKIDLNSSFFQTDKADERKSFDSIENDIFAGTNRLSDSESEVENEQPKETVQVAKNEVTSEMPPQTSKLNFEQLHNYTKKMEEAKKMVQKYEAKKKKKEINKKPADDDITNLLSLGEMKVDEPEGFRKSVHSSDFESCSDSDKEDWQEVEESKAQPSTSVPKEGVEITVALPENMKKKKGVDLVASLKRRLNRIKKENQILIHKVHLLCWIAHGNYVNKVLNSESLLALCLSLIPSQHCYPPTRTDLGYLEQFVQWYKTTITLGEKQISKQWSLEKVLKLQLTRKHAYNKNMLVYIFVCILRSLGIQCRLVLSFQVLPLRPPNSELHSLSTKIIESKPSTSTPAKTENEDSKGKLVTEDKPKVSETKKTEVKSKQKGTKTSKKESNSNSTTNKKTETKKSNATQNGVDLKPNEVIFKKGSKDGQRVNPKSPLKNIDNNSKKKKPNLRNLKTEVKTVGTAKSPAKESKSGSRKSKSKEDGESKANTRRENTRSSSRTTTKESSARSLRTKNIAQLDGADDSSDNEPVSKKKPNLKKILKFKGNTCPKNHPKRLKSLPNYEEKSDNETDDDFVSSRNNNKNQKTKSRSVSSTPKSNTKGDVRNDIISIMKSRMKEEKDISQSKLAKNRRSKSQSDEDSDYAPEPIEKKYRSDDEFLEEKLKVKRRVKPKSQVNEPVEKVKKGHDVWVEVFLEAEEKWISVDVVKGAVHCVNGLYSRASHPISYIITWDNNNYIKDVTQRYCPNWNTTTRKLRVDPKWWTQALKPFIGLKTARDKEEDEDLARLQLEKPLPTTIFEYKNHPLYALERHLLKFEAFYPPNPAPLGFIRKEPVYARECVHVLHSREIWMKQAKVVKLGEKPYKIVKARPKYDRLSRKMITDTPLEIFGSWQIEDYEPPTAENGIVPKSAYGSVELFKPCMLPKKTVHLKLPGLNKLARKMNIDSAPALVGFDFHSGFNHPIYDGYVVCEEYEEVLVAAWHLDQEEQEKRELEKLEKRVYGNWKKLIKGLLIRERLKVKYNFGENSEESKGKKRKSKAPKFATKRNRICSDSESD